jgi:hypothetical protein
MTKSEVIALSAVAAASLLLFVASRFASHATWAPELIPPAIVGVWTSEGAVLRNQGALFEGQALYLRSDGQGAMIGGPPPIGFSVVSTFDSATNRLTVRFSPEKGQPCREVSIVYDPQAKLLNLAPGTLLRRHLDKVPAWLSRDFDHSPAHCGQDRNNQQ